MVWTQTTCNPTFFSLLCTRTAVWKFWFLRSSLIWFDFLIDCDRKLPVQQFSLTCDALTAAAALLSLSPQSAAKRQQKTEYCPLHLTPEMTSFRMDSLMYLECITEKRDAHLDNQPCFDLWNLIMLRLKTVNMTPQQLERWWQLVPPWEWGETSFLLTTNSKTSVSPKRGGLWL